MYSLSAAEPDTRFLATTADFSLWPSEGKIVFLGEWCKPPATRSSWRDLSFEVLPYHWEDQEAKHADYLYLALVHAKLLKALTARLNQFHRTDRSIRFWTILVGPWLHMFVESLFDRYSSIRKAKETYPSLHTLLPEYSAQKWIPRDFSQFLKWLPCDDYNQHLYAEVLSGDRAIKVESRPSSVFAAGQGNSRPSYVGFAKRILSRLTALVPDALNQTVIFDSSFQAGDQFKLQLALGQLPFFRDYSSWESDASPDPLERRKGLEMESENEFELLACRLVIEQIPVAYLEAFPEVMELASRERPRSARRILTAVGWYTDEVFKVWAASQAERGARLIAVQHGGGYGISRYMSFEDHERSVSDRFLTWGWEGGGDEKLVPLPAPKLLRAKRQIAANRDGDVLWTLVSVPRYFRRMYSGVEGSTMVDYLSQQARFWSALTGAARKMTTLRLYSQDYGWGIREYMQEEASGLRIEDSAQPFYQRLCKAKLCIATYNSTTYLETLAADFPTLVFWNPAYNQLRDSAVPYFEKLRVCGILHDTPESAASKLNEVCEAPERWWRQPVVQDAREDFCRHFAKTDTGWLTEWSKTLSSI